MASAAPLRILLSRAAIATLSEDIARTLGSREHRLVAPDEPDAQLAEAAFISRDITGLSTKHEFMPATRQVYDLLQAAPQLRWVHVHSAGADRSSYQQLIARGVCVTTSSGSNASVVAQSALLGVLALGRHLPRLAAAQREHRWAPLFGSGLPRDLQGQTAVIVGWGPVGREVARLLMALGMKPVIVRRSAAGIPGMVSVPAERMREALPAADWLVLACPLTPLTRAMIGAAELALLPPHCGFVNVARGEVVDEPALIDALRAGRLLGAYLDVFAHEPLAADSPLWDLPNVIATPHSAGFSDGNEQRVAQIFLENLRRFDLGEPLANVAGAID